MWRLRATNDGTRWAYAITKSSGAGSPGLLTEAVPRRRHGQLDRPGDYRHRCHRRPGPRSTSGDKLVVVVASENAYYYATITITGVPGSFIKVTAGFVASRAPTTDLCVAGRAQPSLWAPAAHHKATDITARGGAECRQREP